MNERKANTENNKLQEEDIVSIAPVRMIIYMKYFEENTWKEVAFQLGWNVTADSARMELERLKK